MGVFDMIVAVTGISLGGAIIMQILSIIGRGRGGDLKLAQERLKQQEALIVDLRHQVDQLQQQLQWNTRLLEAQDRLLKQAGATGSGEARSRLESGST